MKALILAAGYATRLYPLTKDFPKPLIKVGGRTILDWLVDQIETISYLERIYIVTNHRFFDRFTSWREGYAGCLDIDVIDNDTSSNADRRGAIGDIQFSLANRDLRDDLLVCAADNILWFPLSEFVAAFQENRVTHICVRLVENVEKQRRTGIAVLDSDDRVLDFEEKPRAPKSNWGVPPLYIYPTEILPRIKEYLNRGNSPDAPGHFVEWLCKVEKVYAYKITGSVLDIGNKESLAAARKILEEGRVLHRSATHEDILSKSIAFSKIARTTNTPQ